MQIDSRLLSGRGNNESLFPSLTLLRSGTGVEGGGEEGMGMLGSLGCFSGSSDCRWVQTTHLLTTAGAVCSKSGCRFSHIVHWSCYHFAAHCRADRHLTLALDMCCLQREVDVQFIFFYNHFVMTAHKLLVSAAAPVNHVFYGCCPEDHSGRGLLCQLQAKLLMLVTVIELHPWTIPQLSFT